MTPGLSAGDLRHRVTLSRVSANPVDSVGQATRSYATVGSYYALVECLGGSETTNNPQLKGLLNYRVTLRAASGPVYPSDRLAWGPHTLEVTSVVLDPFGVSVVVLAIEKGAQ